jgi:hypothetical protein
VKLDVNQAIKVLKVNPKDGSLRSCHGGNFQWDPPILNKDGSYTPGSWTPSAMVDLGESGYHLTDYPTSWWNNSNIGAYLVEYRGKVQGSFNDDRGRKIAVESCRLLRPLTSEELARYRIFIDGEHQTWDTGPYVVAGNAFLLSCTCEVSSQVSIFAFDNSMVRAMGNVIVRASGNSDVYAYDNAVVTVRMNASVYALGAVNIYAFGDSEVYAYNGATVMCFERAKVTASNDVDVAPAPRFEGVITMK